MRYSDEYGRYDMSVSLDIEASDVRISCELDRWNPQLFEDIHFRTIEIARAVVDLIAFREGFGIILFVDRYLDPAGTVHEIAITNAPLVGICKSFSGDNFGEAVNLVAATPRLFVALNDLVLCISWPHQSAMMSYRSVEAIRHLIAPGIAEKRQWEVFHAALNTSKSYVMLLTEVSTPHRHGDRSKISPDTLTEIVSRAWIIMDRYLFLRLRGLEALPLDEFPLLTG